MRLQVAKQNREVVIRYRYELQPEQIEHLPSGGVLLANMVLVSNLETADALRDAMMAMAHEVDQNWPEVIDVPGGYQIGERFIPYSELPVQEDAKW